MEQIVIQVTDKEKAKLLTKLLASLNFVVSIKTSDEQEHLNDSGIEVGDDFFALAGLWEKRDIDYAGTPPDRAKKFSD